MKKWSVYFLVSLAVLFIVVIGGNEFPKYASRLLGFGMFLLIDISYWIVFRDYTRSLKKRAGLLLNVVFWIPVSAFLIFALCAAIWDVQNWPAFFRIYFTGILVPLFVWKILVILFLLLGELLALPVNLWRFFRYLRFKEKVIWLRIRAFITTGIVAGSLLAAVMFSGFFFWVYSFQVRTVTVLVRDLPSAFEGFRIVQLSDIHLGSWISAKPLNRAVDKVNDLHPDLVVFTGDLVNYMTKEAYVYEASMRKIKATSGIYSILGNHDYGDYVKWNTPLEKSLNNKELQDFYSKLGWKLLKNEHVFIRKGTDSIALLGVENWSANKLWVRRGDLGKSIAGTERVAVKILLSHDPSHWRAEVIEKYPNISLTLSGHTHAMQMGWETARSQWSPAEWIFPEWGGLYKNEEPGKPKQYLYVNRGLGHLGFPGRVGIRPEITLIILKKE